MSFPANIEVSRIPRPTRGIDPDANIGGRIAAIAIRSNSSNFLKKRQILFVTIRREIARRMLPRGHRRGRLDSPVCEPNQFFVFNQHISQPLECRAMRVEVPDYLSFVGWRSMGEKDSHARERK